MFLDAEVLLVFLLLLEEEPETLFTIKTSPAIILSPLIFRGFNSLSARSDILYLSAIPEIVSPFFTVCVVVAEVARLEFELEFELLPVRTTF